VRALFLVNARSGRGRDVAQLSRMIDAASRAARWDFAIEETREKDDLDRIITGDSFAAADVIYAVGGDGTVNEVGRRLIGTNKTLGILPTGSGNGLARHLLLPLDIERSLAAMPTGVSTAIDTATVNGIPFLGTFGIGFDAVVADRFARAGTRGIETYIREAMKAFISYKPQPYEIDVDGEILSETAFVVAVANSNQYGNDARIAPNASLRDGLLDVCVLRNARIIDAPDIIQRLFRGTLHDCSYLLNRKGRRVVIRRAEEESAHIDGEPLSMPRELVVLIQPASLNVWVAPHAVAKI
jgi:YegS/Rv2252/BmrU family lipid kinase